MDNSLPFYSLGPTEVCVFWFNYMIYKWFLLNSRWVNVSAKCFDYFFFVTCELIVFVEILKEILENANIIKVGFNSRNQAQFLIKNYGIFVGSILDLNEMDKSTNYSPENVKQMCKTRLNEKFSERTNVALFLIELFNLLAERLQPKGALEDQKVYIKRIIRDFCLKYIDMSYG